MKSWLSLVILVVLFLPNGAFAQSAGSVSNAGAVAIGGGVDFTIQPEGDSSGGEFRQFRVPQQFTYPFGPGYTGPWNQAHNYGVPILARTYTSNQLKKMGYSWWNTTDNNKWVETRDHEYCKIEIEVLPSMVKDGVLSMPDIEIPVGGILIGYVNVRSLGENADSLDVLVRGMEKARQHGANKLIVYQHNVTSKMKGRNYGLGVSGGVSKVLGQDKDLSLSGDAVIGFSLNESGPDIRPFIRAIAIEYGTYVPCKDGDGNPVVKN